MSSARPFALRSLMRDSPFFEPRAVASVPRTVLRSRPRRPSGTDASAFAVFNECIRHESRTGYSCPAWTDANPVSPENPVTLSTTLSFLLATRPVAGYLSNRIRSDPRGSGNRAETHGAFETRVSDARRATGSPNQVSDIGHPVFHHQGGHLNV